MFDSPAPKGLLGRWVPRAALPIPRSEMAWSTVWNGRMHVVGGYGEGRVDRPYHHIYDPAADKWFDGAPLPRGANHVAVAAMEGRVYALGGFLEQNRNPDTNAYAYDAAADKWTNIAPLPRARGAAATAILDGKLHLIGGAGAPTAERASVGWHEVYDPKADKWETRKALPGARDHVGSATFNGAIHIIGGRFNTFEYNTNLHHVYLPERDTWELRAPLPTRVGPRPCRLSRPVVRHGRRGRHHRERPVAAGESLRADGKLRSGDRHMAAACADADAASRGCGHRHR